MKYIKTKVNKILLVVLAVSLIILLLIYKENQTYENKGEYLINKIENFINEHPEYKGRIIYISDKSAVHTKQKIQHF